MSQQSCTLEPKVLQASASGIMTQDLREHLVSCEDCTAAAAVSGWMMRFATVEERKHPLPTAAALRLKARIHAEESEAELLSRRMTVVQQGIYALVASLWAALLTWKWTALEAWVAGLNPAHLISAGPGSAPPISLTLLAVILTLGSVTIMLAAQTIAED